MHQISGHVGVERKADVVFIHGLGGDALSTWRHGKDESTSWPHWLAREFRDVGVWSLSYAASPTKWARALGWISKSRNAGHSMALPERSLQVLDRMAQAGLGQLPILFICHSLGGLLAKQVLRTADDLSIETRMQQVAANTRAVLFLATPHCGAELASMLNAFRSVVGATVSIEDLRAHDAHLIQLYNWYRRNAVRLGIETNTYYEKRGVGGLSTIVNSTSSQCGVGPDAVPLDEDHLSIAKPRGPDAQVCGAARALLRNYVLVSRNSTPADPGPQELRPFQAPHVVVRVGPGSFSSGEVPRVPCELPPLAEKHFGRPAELLQLTTRLLERKNCAVVGPAGIGKTALAAEALRAVVGRSSLSLSASPFPDGIVYLDLYSLRGRAEPAWSSLANALGGPGLMDTLQARERATEACRARSILVIFEGGEEADGQEGRASIAELFGVLSAQNRWLLLTRFSSQALPSESVELKEALQPQDAADLLESLTHGRLTGAARQRVLALVEGHPLALTWAGNLLARDDDEPARLVHDWQAGGLPGLADPKQAEHTLEWLFNRSMRNLDAAARQLVAGAGLLARAPFPFAAMLATLGNHEPDIETCRDALKSLVQRGLLRKSGEPDHWEFTHVLGYRFARKETGSDITLRERLARWLSAQLQLNFDRSPGQQDEPPRSRALEHGAALLRADDDHRLWEALAQGLLYDTCDRFEALGRLDLVRGALAAVAEWLARLPELEMPQPRWLRECSTLLIRRGDVLNALGDLAGALVAHREAQAICRRLANAEPSNGLWQRDLGLCLEKVGNDLRAQGDLVGAISAYREFQVIMRSLVASEPSNTVWQRELGVSHSRLGDMLSAQGDLARALGAYRDSQAIKLHLAQADPANAVWQRDVSVSYIKVGDVLKAQGDLTGALAACRESLAISRRLTEADPSNALEQRNLSLIYSKVGAVLKTQGDLGGALAAHRDSQAICRRLTEVDPSNTLWQRDLSVSHHSVGSVLSAQGDLAGALASHRESQAISRRLAEVQPSNADWQRDLSVGYINLGGVLSNQGDLDGALAAYRESQAISRRLAERDPSNVDWQRDLAVSHNRVGNVLISQGDLTGALRAYLDSQAIRKRLTEADPSNAVWQRDLSFSLTRMAEFHELQGDRLAALALAEEGLAIDERLAALDPTNATWQQDLVVSRTLVNRLRS